MVERYMLRLMTQASNETTRAFVARLRDQAKECQFVKVCGGGCTDNTDYTDDQIKDTLIVGLNDYYIKLKLLGQTNRHMSLEECIEFIEAEEKRIRTTSKPTGALPTAVELSNVTSTGTGKATQTATQKMNDRRYTCEACEKKLC